MKLSFKLGNGGGAATGPSNTPVSNSTKSSGGLVLGGLSLGSPTSSSGKQHAGGSLVDLGFSSARESKDSTLRNVTAFTGLSGTSGFIGETTDKTFASKKRQREGTVVIECKKRLKPETSNQGTTKDVAPGEDGLEEVPREDVFHHDLLHKKGGLIVNKTAKRKDPDTKPNAPLLMRMGHKGRSSGAPVKSEGSIAFSLGVKHEPDVITQGSSDRLVAPAVGSDHRPDFKKVKVEEFGMAMLRGMGYDPNKEEYKDRDKLVDMKQRAYVRGGLGSDKFFEEGHEPDVKKDPSAQENDEDDSYYSYDSSSDSE